jgi:anti-sigma B factor antagonist
MGQLIEYRKRDEASVVNMGEMTIPKRHVIVKQLPETLSGKQGRMFLREMQTCVELDRPRIVLDCSKVRRLDKSGVHLLLCCLEEALKRNGDVRLAALSPRSQIILEITGANRLFDIYDTTADAVKSFHQLTVGMAMASPVLVRSQRNSESAA